MLVFYWGVTHTDATFVLNQVRGYFSWPREILDAHTVVRSGFIEEETILFGYIQGCFPLMGYEIPTKVAFFDWDA